VNVYIPPEFLLIQVELNKLSLNKVETDEVLSDFYNKYRFMKVNGLSELYYIGHNDIDEQGNGDDITVTSSYHDSRYKKVSFNNLIKASFLVIIGIVLTFFCWRKLKS